MTQLLQASREIKRLNEEIGGKGGWKEVVALVNAKNSALKEDRDKHFSAAAHYESELFCANKKLSAIRGLGVEDLIRDWVAGTPTNKLENELVTLSWGDLRHLATHIVAKLKEVGE